MRKRLKWTAWLDQSRSSWSRSRSETRPTSGSAAASNHIATARALRQRTHLWLAPRLVGERWSSAVVTPGNLEGSRREKVRAALATGTGNRLPHPTRSRQTRAPNGALGTPLHRRRQAIGGSSLLPAALAALGTGAGRPSPPSRACRGLEQHGAIVTVLGSRKASAGRPAEGDCLAPGRVQEARSLESPHDRPGVNRSRSVRGAPPWSATRDRTRQRPMRMSWLRTPRGAVCTVRFSAPWSTGVGRIRVVPANSHPVQHGRSPLTSRSGSPPGRAAPCLCVSLARPLPRVRREPGGRARPLTDPERRRGRLRRLDRRRPGSCGSSRRRSRLSRPLSPGGCSRGTRRARSSALRARCSRSDRSRARRRRRSRCWRWPRSRCGSGSR